MPIESSPWTPDHWLRFAASDLLLARSRPAGVLLDLLCFHAQQEAQKAIKAVSVAQRIEFPRTVNLRVLLELLAERTEVPAPRWSAVGLTDFAVSSRYPGALEAVTDEEYAEASYYAPA